MKQPLNKISLPAGSAATRKFEFATTKKVARAKQTFTNIVREAGGKTVEGGRAQVQKKKKKKMCRESVRTNERRENGKPVF